MNFINPYIEVHSGCILFLDIMSKAEMNMAKQVFLW